MPRINLLPWRAELRQKRKKDFMTAVLAAVLIGGGAVYASKLVVQGQIAAQNERNGILRTEITKLDEQIAAIRSLQTQRDRLVARMEIIDRLQRSRPEIVHVFDEIVNAMPDGAFLTSVKQENSRIEFEGIGESNGRVAELLRNVEDSPWLKYDKLGTIDNPGEAARAEFAFVATQATTEEAMGTGETP
jgi:type IV pilus assembly protein PilN